MTPWYGGDGWLSNQYTAVLMKVVVIGGTGHIGTHLIPRLVQRGHEVVCVARGSRDPYKVSGDWASVERVKIDRDAEEKAGSFGGKIAVMRPDVVIDLICFTLASAANIVEALRGKVQHFLSCGTIWVHGHSTVVPTTEEEPRRPFGDYGTWKADIERFLLGEARLRGFPATVLHPGHIVGQGWVPLNPAGNFNPKAFETIARGEELALPNLGLETVHHVHADDVAQAFCRALERRSVSIGESFHVVSAAALSLRGYAERMALWFGREPRLAFLPWEKWKTTVSEEDAAATWDHIAHSPCCSIEKARQMLGYQPRYTSLEAVQESVAALIEKGTILSSSL
jgi:nucleoside-diphosphate-sugar epimerase